jgi:TorA maturation chaperone TorD
MSTPHAKGPSILPRPACTPAAIRAVLAANADAGVLQRYDRDLDAAFERARQDGDLTPLVQAVRRWWFEADAWRDPDAQRAHLARVDRYLSEGPPPPEERMSREEYRARYGA